MTDSGSPEATDRKGPPPREITRAVRLLWVGLFAAPILSLCLIALYAVQARDWLTSLAILGSGTMVASGFALLGTLFGFLFGVPHVVQHGVMDGWRAAVFRGGRCWGGGYCEAQRDAAES